jgi:hypothetical protein
MFHHRGCARAGVRALGLRLRAAGESKCADTVTAVRMADVSEAGVGGAVEAVLGEDSYRGLIKPECRPERRPGAESAAAP